jgi:DNA-binding transcriptional ArsR family regulator
MRNIEYSYREGRIKTAASGGSRNEERKASMQNALRQFKADIFQAMAHPTRIAIVEMLRDGEVSAGQIFEGLNVEQANASQHLAVLRSKQIVVSRKDGNQVYYAIRNPLLIEVLNIMRRYFEEQLQEAAGLLKEMQAEATGTVSQA